MLQEMEKSQSHANLLEEEFKEIRRRAAKQREMQEADDDDYFVTMQLKGLNKTR